MGTTALIPCNESDYVMYQHRYLFLYGKSSPDCKLEYCKINFLHNPGPNCGLESCKIGYLYENGKGVTVDYMKAYECYQLSINKGSIIATYFMNTLLKEKIFKIIKSLIIRLRRQKKIINDQIEFINFLRVYPGKDFGQAEQDFYTLAKNIHKTEPEDMGYKISYDNSIDNRKKLIESLRAEIINQQKMISEQTKLFEFTKKNVGMDFREAETNFYSLASSSC